jgi:hypothetical protein
MHVELAFENEKCFDGSVASRRSVASTESFSNLLIMMLRAVAE